jgi:hypothetical protein
MDATELEEFINLAKNDGNFEKQISEAQEFHDALYRKKLGGNGSMCIATNVLGLIPVAILCIITSSSETVI